jgi:hypothetical protein
MTSPLPNSPEVDIEKAEEGLSIHSSDSSLGHGSKLSSHNDKTEIHEDVEDQEHDREFSETKPGGGGVLGRVLSKISTKSSWKDPGPPPDGGLEAWMQVLMGHLVIMNTWGFINSFGVFQSCR